MSIDPEHIEAVARAIDPIPFDNEANLPAWEFYRKGALRHATYLLTSTDPAVHAALLAALVRAGVLTEEHRDCCSTCGAGYGSCENIDEACTDVEWIEQRRYMSKWEETCD